MVSLSEIRTRLNRKYRHNSALDAENNEVRSGNLVRVSDRGSKYKMMEGNVKWVCDGTLFLHSVKYRENSGVFVVRARQVRLVGASAIAMQRKKEVLIYTYI